MAALVQSLTQFNNFFQKIYPKSPKTPFFNFPPASQGKNFDRLDSRNRSIGKKVTGLLPDEESTVAF